MNQSPSDHLFLTALQHHQAGRLAEAEGLYRQILAANPSHADALHMLGQVAHQVGQHGPAAELIRRAIALNPNNVIYYGSLGQVLAALGRRKDEIEAYRKIISLRPDLPEGYYNLGIALAEEKRNEEAMAAYRRAIELRPDYFEPINNLAVLLEKQKKYDQAIELYRRVLALQPNSADAHYNLGTALDASGDTYSAIKQFRQALAIKPRHPEALINLSKSLHVQGQFAESEAASRQALALSPESGIAHINLGVSLWAQQKIEEGLSEVRSGAKLKPDDPDVRNAAGNLLRLSGQFDEAESHHRRALAIDPQSHASRFSLGYIQLLRGNYEEGFRGYEARWHLDDVKKHTIPGPRWDGSDLHGKRIAIHFDQGFGDTIQFVRFVPQVKARGGYVILRCQSSLRRLLEGQCEIDEVSGADEPLPQYDVSYPISSLGYMFKTTVATIPAGVPYLNPDPSLVDQWRQRMQDDGRLKVGLAWAGNPQYPDDRNRSTHLQTLAPLGQVPGVQFYSLQKGNAAFEASNPPAGLNLVNLTSDLNDFAETAALIANLDLVITTDTSIPHLAGALAKPIWVLVQYSPDWRWMLDRSDSPWYPTARLFRQPSFGAWEQVVKEVSGSLQGLAEARGAR